MGSLSAAINSRLPWCRYRCQPVSPADCGNFCSPRCLLRAGPMLCQRCKLASQQIPANFQHLLETPTDLPHASGVAAATQAADHLTAWTFSLGMPRSPGGTLCMITLNKTNSVSQNLVICVARGTLVLAFAHLLRRAQLHALLLEIWLYTAR